MFHRQIDADKKERLEKLFESIKLSLKNEGFEHKKFIKNRRATGSDLKPLNQVKMYFSKENVNYMITLDILR
jgi:hypothetical protein